jgi:class 3 adenylate cyclase
MIELSELRIPATEALPFAREKLRACLVVAGLRPVAASQVTAAVSQAVRERIPAMVHVALDENRRRLLLGPPAIAGRYASIDLDRPPGNDSVERMKGILARFTREELLYDLERQVEERTADLARERERSERLLKNMLPEQIAERMKLGETIADSHTATVLFADLKGFTSWASNTAPGTVVTHLDRIFSEFDEIAHRHGVEKIKTIGDAYMAAAGLPVERVDHVDCVVQAALEIVGVLPRVSEEIGVPLDVRAGVHTGPVVAGVIGTKKHAYDIWGDTVNIASRLESHGVPGRVHVSETVHQALGKRYNCEKRGMIELKNRGELQTWFVNGLAVLAPDGRSGSPD